MDDLAIRRAEAADIQAIRGLIDDAFADFEPLIGKQPQPMLDDHLPAIAKGWSLLALAEGDSAAVVIAFPQDRWLFVDVLAVARSMRRKGAAARLLQALEARAREEGLLGMRIQTNIVMLAAQALYRQAGYSETGPFLINGYHRQVFEKAF
jgi:GNAT superfamily N-acetyltransferase